MTAEPIRTTTPARPVLALVPLVAIVFLGFLAIGIPLPVLPAEVHGDLGFGTVVVGWTVGIQSLATVLTRHAAGTTCDRRGPKTAVLLGLPAAALAGAAYLVAAWLPAGPLVRLAVLLAGRLLMGLAESLFLTGAMSWGIGRIGAGKAGLVMAWQGVAISGALGVGAPIGLAIADLGGFAAVAGVVLVLPLAAAAIALGLPGVPPAGGTRLPFTRVIGRIWLPGLGLALGTVAFAAMAAFLVLDYAAHGWPGAGLALTGYAAGFILLRLVGGHLPDRLGGVPVALGSLAIEALGQLLLWSAGSSAVAMAGATVTGMGYSLLFPAMGVEAIRRVPGHNRGLAIAGYVVFFDITLGLAGPATGALAGAWGYPSVFLAGAAAAAAAMLLAGACRARPSD